MIQTIWTSERVDELQRLAAMERFSAREIASTLSCAGVPITKNMVIGRCWRTGIKLGPDVRKLTRAQVWEILDSHESGPALARRLGMSADCVQRLRRCETHLEDRIAHRMRNPFSSSHKSCLWPYGHPDDPQFHFCGGDQLPGKPYCAEHAARAYVRVERRTA